MFEHVMMVFSRHTVVSLREIIYVTGSTKNLHILNMEVVFKTVWGAVYLYQWVICLILSPDRKC